MDGFVPNFIIQLQVLKGIGVVNFKPEKLICLKQSEKEAVYPCQVSIAISNKDKYFCMCQKEIDAVGAGTRFPMSFCDFCKGKNQAYIDDRISRHLEHLCRMKKPHRELKYKDICLKLRAAKNEETVKECILVAAQAGRDIKEIEQVVNELGIK